jgi:ribosomal protein S18 acetylase RimI-like enzyme
MPEINETIFQLHPKDTSSESFHLLRIPVRGSCMSPFILPEDIIVVRKIQPENLKKGMVVAYKACESIIVHRFFGYKKEGGHTLLKIRGDLSSGSFEYLRAEEILGYVIAVERGEKIISVDNWRWRVLGLICESARPAISLLFPPKHLPHKLSGKFLSVLQSFGLYRKFAWSFFGRKVLFRLAIDEDLQQISVWDGSNQKRAFARHNSEIPNKNIDNTTGLTFVALLGTELVGRICVDRVPEIFNMPSYWAITLVWVRNRYRGCGIGRGLLIAAASALHEQGVEHVCGLVLDNNQPMLALGKHVNAILPLNRKPNMDEIPSDGCIFLTRPILKGLQALKQQGILEKYRGLGCCDKLVDEL